MQQMIKRLFWMVLLALGSQAAWGFALLGPVANGTEDAYQVNTIGYNPLANSPAPPYFIDGLLVGPKNLSEGYRHNTPVMYYTFDETFSGYFGSNGEAAVVQAFDIMNSLTNVSAYSSDLSEFPLNSEGVNYTAQALELRDLKSVTLTELLEQLGLADAVRYTWALHNRYQEPNTTCPAGLEYEVIQRNYDFLLSPLNQLQYSAYVNGELYSYYIPIDLCGVFPAPPDTDALAIPTDPLNNYPPVSSGEGVDFLSAGAFYTGLTRDDMAGWRYLISSNNLFNPSLDYTEAPATGSLLSDTNTTTPTLLVTSNLNYLVSEAATNNPTTLQTLFPGLELASTNSYFSNVVSQGFTAYLTNIPGSEVGTPPSLVVKTTLTTNIVQFYQYAFGNVVTNSYYTNSVVTNMTIQTVDQGGTFVLQTNYTAIRTNLVMGDYYIIPAGSCGPDILQTVQTNVTIATTLVLTTNFVADGIAYFYSKSIVSRFTNHVFVTYPCTLVADAVGLYQGVEKIQFVQVADDNFDSLLGRFIQPITNNYTMVVITNGQAVTESFQRIVTTPDFVFAAADLDSGPAALPLTLDRSRTTPLFDNTQTPPGNAGPGTINPGATITYNKVGPALLNVSPNFLNQQTAVLFGDIWGSFDATTNPPVVYPNGTSLATLAAEALIVISPTTLPSGTNGVAYTTVDLSATGGQSPYSWSLASNSPALPPGLSLSPTGVISGTPTASGVFDVIVQLTDSALPAHMVNTIYSITIN
jgi:hypothetical protein